MFNDHHHQDGVRESVLLTKFFGLSSVAEDFERCNHPDSDMYHCHIGMDTGYQ